MGRRIRWRLTRTVYFTNLIKRARIITYIVLMGESTGKYANKVFFTDSHVSYATEGMNNLLAIYDI